MVCYSRVYKDNRKPNVYQECKFNYKGNKHMASKCLCNVTCFHAAECGSPWQHLLAGDVSADVISNGRYTVVLSVWFHGICDLRLH